jgi:hypothetical protein
MTEISQRTPPIPSQTTPRHGQGVTFILEHGRKLHVIVPGATAVCASGTVDAAVCRLEDAAGRELGQVMRFAVLLARKALPEDK